MKKMMTSEVKVVSNEKNENQDIEEVEVDVEETDETVEEDNEKEPTMDDQMKALEEEVSKWKNDYYKVFADMENVKRRMQNEHTNAMKFMMQSFVEQLLPVVDNFERSLAVENVDEQVKNYVKGYDMIYQQLVTVLKENGVEAIEAVGKEFNPNLHQAVMVEKVDGMESNIVVEEMQKGYKLKDRVIRASLVKVSE